AEACLRAVASARRDEVVAMVGDKAKARISKAAIVAGEKLRADPQIGIEVAHFVTCSDFRESAETVPDVDSRVVAEEAVNRLWRASVKHLKRSVRSFSPRSEKPFAGCRKRAIELGLDSVLVSELQIGAPLRAIAPHIHESNARELRVSHIVAFRAVDRKAELQNGRSVAVFVNRNDQAALSIASHKAKIRGGIFANSREPDQKLVQFAVVDGMPHQPIQESLDLLCGARIGPLDFDKLRRRNFGADSRCLRCYVSVPFAVARGKSRQNRLFLFCRLRALSNNRRCLVVFEAVVFL